MFQLQFQLQYVRDMAVKYGTKVVYEGLARYLEY